MFDYIKKAIHPHKDYTNFNVPDTLSHEKRILHDFITVQVALYGAVFLVFPLLILFFIMTMVSFVIPFYYSIFIMVFAFPVCIVWFYLFGTASKVDRTTMTIRFYNRCFCTDPHKKNFVENTRWRLLNLIYGRHPLVKYKIPDNEFKKHFPVDEIHENGLIEFSDGHFGVMLKIDPPRSSSDNTYSQTLEGVFNSLTYGDMLKVMASSRYEVTTTYTDHILSVANDPDTPPSHKKHLQSLYVATSETSNDKIYWQFKALLVFDADNIEDANIAVQTRIPGLKHRFRAAGIHMYQVVNMFDIQKIYLQQLQREVLKL